ncbi:hypothetical protein [[Acholeplasma] multilocale]|uniref:hypothetical protein n=1 Tax=[Acholeplasma] multilocale TaxID=264638 RepID=UPI00047A158A|nr:hypothetical protein [[Acholeplasma] multilocale]
MKKKITFAKSISLAYLIISFGFVASIISWRETLGMSETEILFSNFIFIVASLAFSAFSLTKIGNVFDQAKRNNFKDVKNVNLDRITFTAIIVWFLGLVGQIYLSVSLSTDSGIMYKILSGLDFSNDFLQTIYSLQLTFSVLILAMLVAVFSLSVALFKSKTLVVDLTDLKEFAGFKIISKLIKNKSEIGNTLKNSVDFEMVKITKGFFPKKDSISTLTINNIKSSELRQAKKGLTPPNLYI